VISSRRLSRDGAPSNQLLRNACAKNHKESPIDKNAFIGEELQRVFTNLGRKRLS